MDNNTTSKKLHEHKNKVLKNDFSTVGVADEKEILLLNAPSKNDEVYRALNIPSRKDYVNKQIRDIQILTHHDKMFKGHESFKGKHIKKIANIYYLKLLQMNELKSYLPEETIEEITKFKDKFESVDFNYDSKFFILCSPKYFRKKNEGIEVNNFIAFFRADKGRDAEEDEIFIQITSKGQDWSEFRRLLKYVDNKMYNDKGEGISKLAYLILFVIINLIPSIIFLFKSMFLTSSIFLGIFLLFMSFNYIEFESYNKWNKK